MQVSRTNAGSIFIGHGRSAVWRDLKEFLTERLSLRCEEFNLISPAGLTTVQRLQEMLRNAVFAFLVMTGEDKHADGTFHARENVIYELGLFTARLGPQRAVVLLEEGCAEFSNIAGVTHITFSNGGISTAFERIREVLEREGIIPLPRNRIPWWKQKSLLFAVGVALTLLAVFWIRFRQPAPLIAIPEHLPVGATITIQITQIPAKGDSAQAFGQAEANGKQSIEVTDIPHAGKGGAVQELISGKVRGVDSSKHKVVIYAFAGGTWWVQPTVAEPLTDLNESGGWQTVTHLGSTYAVLLVTLRYKPPATMSDVPKTGGDVLAVTLFPGKV